MITPEEIKERARKKYISVLQKWLRGEPFTPIDFPVGKPPSDMKAARIEMEKLYASASTGYTVQTVTRDTRTAGKQTLPDRILINSLEDYLRLIGKTKEFQHFTKNIALIRQKLPQLESWLQLYPLAVIQNADQWQPLLKVCIYFINNPRPNCYIRELPIEVHTKFIETNKSILRQLLDVLLPAEMILDVPEFEQRFGLRYDEPCFRLRLLDQQFQRYDVALDDLSLPLSQMKNLPLNPRYVIIVENKITFLTLPALPDTIGIWGAGFKAVDLKQVKWLYDAEILYWGDMDAQGFQILSGLRQYYPHLRSILMDQNTFEAYRMFVTPGTLSTIALANLTGEEAELYTYLLEYNQRLEQEHLPHSIVVQTLNNIIYGKTI